MFVPTIIYLTSKYGDAGVPRSVWTGVARCFCALTDVVDPHYEDADHESLARQSHVRAIIRAMAEAQRATYEPFSSLGMEDAPRDCGCNALSDDEHWDGCR